MKPSCRLCLLVLVLAISPVSCAAARLGTTVPKPSGLPMQRVTVLSYNTLHGLEPSGLIVKPSESNEARQARRVDFLFLMRKPSDGPTGAFIRNYSANRQWFPLNRDRITMACS